MTKTQDTNLAEKTKYIFESPRKNEYVSVTRNKYVGGDGSWFVEHINSTPDFSSFVRPVGWFGDLDDAIEKAKELAR